MQIRLLTSRAGPTGFYLEGDVIDVPDEEARRMIRARLADPVGVENALAPGPSMNRGTPAPALKRK